MLLSEAGGGEERQVGHAEEREYSLNNFLPLYYFRVNLCVSETFSITFGVIHSQVHLGRWKLSPPAVLPGNKKMCLIRRQNRKER